MKKVFFAFAILSSSTAFAGRWFCTAEGYDHNNQRMSVSGEYKSTQRKAERSALSTCRAFLRGCTLGSCFNMEFPEEPQAPLQDIQE